MTKLGRNDTCHCGSGKKYKKCCSEVDELRERAQRQEEQLRVRDEKQRIRDSWEKRTSSCSYQKGSEDDPFRDEDDDAAEDFLWQLRDLDFFGKLSRLQLLLDEKSSLLPGVVFSAFDLLRREAATSDQRRQVSRCFQRLREEYPDLYLENSIIYAGWRIIMGLTDGITDEISSIFRDAALQAENDLDTFSQLSELLAYHNRMDELLQGMNLAWPQLRLAEENLLWGYDDFVFMLGDFETYAWLERGDEADFDTLVRLMNPFFPELDLPDFRKYLGRISGEIVTEWSPEELSWGGKSLNIVGLFSQEFLGYLRYAEGVPFSRGSLAADKICEYLRQRHDGELNHRGAKKPPKPLHQLCPDVVTLEEYLSRNVGFITKHGYIVGAILELIPAWLRFLESRKLLDTALRERIIAGLRPILEKWCGVLEEITSDRILVAGIARAWAE